GGAAGELRRDPARRARPRGRLDGPHPPPRPQALTVPRYRVGGMEFAPLAEHIVDAVLEANPVTAHYAGDHRFDHRLPDLSTDAVAADVAMLRDAAHALSQVDTDLLDEAERVDHEILSSIVDKGIFDRADVREHEWNPLKHNPGPLLQALMDRPFAPVEERLEALADRLA